MKNNVKYQNIYNFFKLERKRAIFASEEKYFELVNLYKNRIDLPNTNTGKK